MITRDPEWLTMPEVARHYRRSIWALRAWRRRGVGPAGVIGDGGKVLYSRAEVDRYDAWLATTTRQRPAGASPP